MALLNKNFLNTTAALVVKVAAALSVLLLNAVITRTVAIEQVGTFFNLNTFVLFCVMLAAMGIPPVLMRRSAELAALNDYTTLKKTVSISLLFLVFVAFITATFSLYILHLPQLPKSADFSFLIILWICLGLVLRTLGEVFRGINYTQTSNLLSAVNSHGAIVTLLIAMALYLFYKENGVVDFPDIVSIYVVVLTLVTAASFFFLYRIFLNKALRSGSTSQSQGFSFYGPLKSGLLLSVNELTIYAMTQGDIWFASYWGGAREAALYGVAGKMAFVTSLFLMAINSMLPPLFVTHAMKDQKNNFEKELYKLVLFAAIVALIWLMTCFVFGDRMLAVLFGGDYRYAYPYLVILVLGHFVSVITGPCGLLLLMARKEKALLIGTLTAALIYIPVVFISGFYGGAIGVACASAIAYALINIVYAIQVKRLMKINSGIIFFNLKRWS